MKSLNRDLTNDQIREILHNTSTDLGEVGRDPIFGYGLLNACKALEQVPVTNYTISTPPSSTQLTSQVNFIIIDFPVIIVGMIIMVFFEGRKMKKGKVN